MTLKIIPVLLLLFTYASCQQFSNNWAVFLAQINLNLPSTTYPFPGGNYIKLFNGNLVDKKGPYVGATLLPKVINGDFNNDGYPDAAVILNVVYQGIGYFDNIIFVVLQDFANGPQVTNGIIVGQLATYVVDVFSTNVDNNKIILQFMNRLPGQPKAVAPSVPTVWTLKVTGKVLSIETKKTLTKACYPFI